MFKKAIFLFMAVMLIFAGLCSCGSEFDDERAKIDEDEYYYEDEYYHQEAELKISDFEISNVAIDYLRSSSYSNYLHVTGIIENKSNQKAGVITLTIYLYQDDSLVLSEKEYVFDLGSYDQNSFDFMVDKIKLLTCDEYVVKVTDVF